MTTYDVNVMRTGWSYKTIRVEGETESDAVRTALDCAGDELFCESDYDHDVVDITELPPPEPPMHESTAKHRFKPGDVVFLRDGTKVSRQTVGRVQVALDTSGVVVAYIFWGVNNNGPFHKDYVFATAEEAFK